MKKIYLLSILIIAILFSQGCNGDDSSQEQTSNQRTFTFDCDRELALVAVRINNSEGHTIIQHTYSDISEATMPVLDNCEEIIVFVQDQGYYQYNYQLKANDGSILLEDTADGFDTNSVEIDISQY